MSGFGVVVTGEKQVRHKMDRKLYKLCLDHMSKIIREAVEGDIESDVKSFSRMDCSYPEELDNILLDVTKTLYERCKKAINAADDEIYSRAAILTASKDHVLESN